MRRANRCQQLGAGLVLVAVLAGSWGCAGSFPLTDSSLAGLIDALTSGMMSGDGFWSNFDGSFDPNSGGWRDDGHWGGHDRWDGDSGDYWDDDYDGHWDGDGYYDDDGDWDDDYSEHGHMSYVYARLDGAGSAYGEAEYFEDNGRRAFDFEAYRVPAGSYALLINGVEVATITVGSSGYAEVHFDSQPGPGVQPLPDNFPQSVQPGDQVALGDLLSGTFASHR